jgi:cellulose synthase/poly-beta-1,6-N-acetylglucosamine synthase-like glycosyltransferase
MHDAGGDRSQTVAALPALIASYRAAGFRFTTVSAALGLPPTAAERPAATVTQWQGKALLVSDRGARLLVQAVTWALLPLGLLSLLRSVLVVALARRHVRLSAARIEGPEYLPPVTVVVPAYNEAVGIERAVRALIGSDYPDLEVVVVDDGSTDGTGDIVAGLGLPGVQLVRQANGGKAAALATGIAHASHDVLVMLDGDTVFEADTIRKLVQPLRDPRVGAVSGNTKVGNRGGLLGRWQHLEYVSGFNLDRRLLERLGCITTVPGACGAFRREAVLAAGGLSTDTLAEDTDLTMAILRAGYLVLHEERARAWTEAPSTVTDLWRQRWRWGYGTLQCLWKHRGALRQQGALGRVGLPYMLAFRVLLPHAAPLIDVFALHGVLVGEGTRVAVVWLAYAALSVAIAAYALHLDGESYGPLWSLPLQQFFYRQLIYLVVIQSLVSAVSGLHLPWHKLHRTGDVTVQEPEKSLQESGQR